MKKFFHSKLHFGIPDKTPSNPSEFQIYCHIFGLYSRFIAIFLEFASFESPPLLAHRASLALAHLSTETFFDEEVKAVAKGIEADGVDNLAHKGKHCGYGVFVRSVSNDLLGDSEK